VKTQNLPLGREGEESTFHARSPAGKKKLALRGEFKRATPGGVLGEGKQAAGVKENFHLYMSRAEYQEGEGNAEK